MLKRHPSAFHVQLLQVLHECGVCINVSVNSSHCFICVWGEGVAPPLPRAFPCFSTHATKSVRFSNVMVIPFRQTVTETCTSSLHHLLTPFQFILHVLNDHSQYTL